MAVRRGISILDLLPQTTNVAGFVPDNIVERLGVLTVLDHRSTSSPTFFLHEGTLQSLAEALDLNTSDWALRIPGLTHGLPFRLALQRPAAGSGSTQEAAPSLWTLDIEVWDVELQLPLVRAARQKGGDGIHPLELEPITGSARQQRVYLVARGTLRIAGGGANGTQVQLVDSPDPFDPTAPTGTVLRVTARPPHFTFGDSKFGMTVDQLVIDLSDKFTPPEVIARGHDETWQGLSYREAAFYLPPSTPLVHSLSVVTRDVIVGKPDGLQGELRLEFGQDFADQYNSHLTILQQVDGGSPITVPETTPGTRGTVLQYAATLDGNGRPRRFKAKFDLGHNIPGHTDLGVIGVYWRLPTGQEGNSDETPWFDAPTDGVLRYRLRVGPTSSAPATPTTPTSVPDGQTELTEVTVQFPRGGTSPTANPPLLDAVIGSSTFANVVHLRGPRARLVGITLRTRGASGAVPAAWTLGSGSAPAGSGNADHIVLPALPDNATSLDITARTADGLRRVRVEVVPSGPLTIGHQETATAGSPSVVTVVGTGNATPTDVLETFRAAEFHARAERNHAASDATITGTEVMVPTGTIAEVEVPVPVGADDPLPSVTPPAPTPSEPAVIVTFDFKGTVVQDIYYPLHSDDPGLTTDLEAAKHEEIARPLALRLPTRPGSTLPPHGQPNPALVSPPGPNGNVDKLRQWIDQLPKPAPADRQFFLVARTDDLWRHPITNESENNSHNDDLATGRLNSAKSVLAQAGVSSSAMIGRIERVGWTGTAPPSSAPARFNYVGRLALPPGTVTSPTGATRPVWNRRWTPDDRSEHTEAETEADINRQAYHSVEIFAYDPTATPPPPPPPPPSNDGVPTSILVPGPDGAPPPAGSSTATSPPPTDYRVRLQVKWDSPTVVNVSDAIPTEAEALVAWKSATTELPATNTSGPQTLPAPTGADYWEVLLRWAYDARTGETEVTGALSLPDGAVTFTSDALGGALAFGPAFTALVDPRDSISDPAGQFVVAAALFGAGALVGTLLQSNANTNDPHSRVEIDKVSVGYRWNGDTRVSATVDYNVDLRVNTGISGAGTLVGHLKLKYKGVGLRFDANDGGLKNVSLTYDNLSVEVADPGTWSLGGPLGNLIRVAASRIGNGSTWMEYDLEFALDLGVIRLEGAVIRITLDSGIHAELRGLTAKVHIDNVLDGKGSVAVGDGGAFRAMLALQIIPAKLGAYGSLAVDHDFVAVEVGVMLPVGLPIGATGLAVYGFMGRFVANGARNLDGLSNADPVQRELDWYTRQPDLKYTRKSGQYALGLGAVIGTLPDNGFTLNAEGSICIGFPDVSVIFGINAKIAAERKLAATESGSNTATILGLTLFEPDAIMIAIRINYEIPKVLKLMVPISAYFPLSASGKAWYIRFGTDNAPDRPGSPITIQLLPGTLDVRAWAFFMVEERQLHGLGGSLVPSDLGTSLDFDGFSLGMGAGFDLRWSAGPFKLEISAFLIVGIGTKPLLLAGAIGIKGELDLVIISVGVDGRITFHIAEDYAYLEGHFCGHVSFFFFEVSGCVDVSFGDKPGDEIPAPDSPIAGIDLCDHLSAIKGSASSTPTGQLPTVWPDTVAVIKFNHYIEDALGSGSDFKRWVAPTAALSPWSGSTELKYAFRLQNVELYKLTAGDPASGTWTKVSGPFDSAWWLPTHRPGVITDPNWLPSTEEGRELGLFHWDPRAWSRWLGEGSQDLPQDPGRSVPTTCDDPKPADSSCAYGKNAQFAAGALARFDATPPAGSLFPSRFSVRASLVGLPASTIAGLAGDAGWTYLPGTVVPLDQPLPIHGTTLDKGWRLPSLRGANGFISTVTTRFDYSKPVQSAELVLQVCNERFEALPIPSGNICDRPPAQGGSPTVFFGQSGTRYSGTNMSYGTTSGQTWVQFSSGVFRGDYAGGGVSPPTDLNAYSVSVDVLPNGASVKISVVDANGAVLGEKSSSGTARQTIALAVPGIRAVLVTPQGAKPQVFEVCWGPTPLNPVVESTRPFGTRALPLVVGIDGAGNLVPLEPKSLTGISPPTLCGAALYTLPADKAKNGWVGVEVLPWRLGDLALIADCAVTLEASAAQSQESDFRQSMRGMFKHLIDLKGLAQPTHQVYLDKLSTYQVRVTWQYQGWRAEHEGDDPPSPSSGTWIDGRTESFTFRTADYGTVGTPASAHTASLADQSQGGPAFDESKFDPRGLSRYLTRAAPDHEDPPHFLDDRIGFWFSADHMEPLVEKYDRIMQVKVLHTSPPPGSLRSQPPAIPGGLHYLDVTVATTIAKETLTWFGADYRFANAALASPCIGQLPPLGSSSVSVTANLQPEEEYDLLLTVVPKTVGAFPETVVARNHFRTSRYHNPSGMLAALGFATPSALQPPTDFILANTAVVPTSGLVIGDAALDAALAGLGMDPWPLPAAPRTTAIWKRPAAANQPWQLAGVLLEADEPIWRAGFKTGAVGEPEPPPRLEVLSLVVRKTYETTTIFLPGSPPIKHTDSLGTLTERGRNAAGTRLLFTAATPIAVSGGTLGYDLQLSLGENGAAGANGVAPLYDRPLLVFQEGE